MAQATSLQELYPALRTLRVGVVGDIMLDRFVFGRVERISPEAPVPVVQVNSDEERLGGGANVAANVAALGVECRLFAAIGPGEQGARLKELLVEHGVRGDDLQICPSRETSVKTRILAGQQQLVRIDRETKAPLSSEDRAGLLAKLKAVGDLDVLIVSDYGKGVVGPELMAHARSLGIPVIVDPKQGNFDLYEGAGCITPNESEAAGASHATIDGDADALRVGEALRLRLKLPMLLLTRGEHGMSLLREGQPPLHLPTEARHVYDVTGAGDTVIATFATLLAATGDAALAARLANLAAGQVVAEVGTALPDANRLAADAAGLA